MTSLKKDQFFGSQGLGHGLGRGVGVDVQLFALLAAAQRGNDRHDAGIAEVVDRGPVDPGDVADVSQVDRLAAGVVELEPLAPQDVGACGS